MHHFKDFNDPEAVIFRERLHQFMETARKLDVDVGFVVMGNEGYANRPVNLQAVPGGLRGVLSNRRVSQQAGRIGIYPTNQG